jgi:hypothetical protein
MPFLIISYQLQIYELFTALPNFFSSIGMDFIDKSSEISAILRNFVQKF